jgi:hypothetical protein
MRGLRRSFWLAGLAALACGGATRSSRAQLVLVTPDDGREPPAVVHGELAYARGTGAPVTWLSLRLRRGPAALIAALPADATVEAGLDAWLASLEAVASPNILPPRSATDCGKTASYAHVSWPRDASTPPSELLLRAPEDVTAALDEQGLVARTPLPAADRYLVWSWPVSELPLTTRTLRIVGGAAPLTLAPGSPFPLLINSITRGPEALKGELENHQLRVTFVAGKPSSDYQLRLQDWLGTRDEPLLEARATAPLFDWSIFADTVSMRPLSDTYALSAGRELPEIEADECAEQLHALRDVDAPGATACGAAVDFERALAAAGREQPTLQRFVVSGAQGAASDEVDSGGEPSTPVLRASLLDDAACPNVDVAPPIVLGPPPPERGSGQTGNAATTVVVEKTVVTDEPADPGCSCDAGRDPYYDDRSRVDCSSDTASEYDSSDGSCSADTSSSSSDDSGCGSDTSSSEGDDTSCDGGSEDSGYDGDTCTGSAAPADRSQKAQARLTSRPRRMKTSLWSLALAAVVLPIRRRKRRQIGGG